MKLGELLDKVKLGEEEYQLNKIVEEIIEDCLVEDELEEGVKYFKMSKRLGKLAEKLQKKVAKVPEVKPLVAKTKAAAKSFEAIENAFASGKITKPQARSKYDSIKKDYGEVVKALRKKETITALKVGGAIAIVGGIVAALAFGLGPLGLVAGAGGKIAAPSAFKQAADALKKAAGVPLGTPPDPTKIFGRGALSSGMIKKLPGMSSTLK